MCYEDAVNFHRGIERFDEGTSSNPFDDPFDEKDEMFDMLNDLSALIKHKREIKALIGVDIEEETINIFHDLLKLVMSYISVVLNTLP